jgi:hypothetical protein
METRTVCPKCKHENLYGPIECARCGIVFSKYKYSTVSQARDDSESVCACGIYNGKETTVCHGCGLAKERTNRQEKGFIKLFI